MDTVKTRLVTQLNYPDLVPYKGISDCFQRVLKEEGVGAFYRGLTPRLLSVVPMIGIQFGFYEVSVNVLRPASYLNILIGSHVTFLNRFLLDWTDKL